MLGWVSTVIASAVIGQVMDQPGVLPQIKAEGLAMARRLESLSFEATLRTSEKLRNGSQRHSEGHLKYIMKPGKFRAEATRRDATGKVLIDCISAYDGSHWQFYLPAANSLALSSRPTLPNPSFEPNPLLLPYGWVAQGKPVATWQDVCSAEAWKSAFQSSRIHGTQTRKGQSCVVVEFPGLIPKTTNRVYFAKDLYFFPMSIESITAGGTVFSTLEVEEYIADSSASIVIPQKLSCSARYIAREIPQFGQMDTEHMAMTINIVPETVQINGRFEDKLFTLPMNHVRYIHDLDAQNAPIVPAKNKWGRWIFFAANGILLIAFAVFYVWRRIRK